MTHQDLEWQRGGKQHVLTTYARLHQDKIGQHWLWAAIERVVAGDSEEEVMRDFGYQKLGAGETASDERQAYPIPEFLRKQRD